MTGHGRSMAGGAAGERVRRSGVKAVMPAMQGQVLAGALLRYRMWARANRIASRFRCQTAATR